MAAIPSAERGATGTVRALDRDKLVEGAREAAAVAAAQAADVDRVGRFPREAIDALRAARLLSAPIPVEFGGPGSSLRTLGLICGEVARACGSSGLVLAMHYSQLICLVRHGMDSAFFRQYLRDAVIGQPLLSSMTSEVGTDGNTRRSICAIEPLGDGRFQLDKESTTGSYSAQADAILVTARRAGDAAASDQVLALVRRGDYELTQKSHWDTLGMRGTCSPAFSLRSRASQSQILPGSYGESAPESMLPYSHILWSSVWHGIASFAVGQAARYVRAQGRKDAAAPSSSATALAILSADLQVLRRTWLSVAEEFDAVEDSARGREALQSMDWTLKLNALKMTASKAAPALVHQALQIIGLAGYRNDSPFSVGRPYRDALSASLMVSNNRIAEQSGAMLRVFKSESY
jgi:acyl-CoA dehydrogenase